MEEKSNPIGKIERISYHESLEDTLKLVELLCRSYLSKHQWKGSLIVDIDDTIVDSDGKLMKPMFQFLQKFMNGFGMYAAKNSKRCIHLVTGRSIETRKETESMLKSFKIPYTSLSLMPYPIKRFLDIGVWKNSERIRIAKRTEPILFSLGDMWTDHVKLDKNLQLAELDATFGEGYVLFRVKDDVFIWGCKLPEFEKLKRLSNK